HLLLLSRGGGVPVGGRGRPRAAALAEALTPRRPRGTHLAAQGRAARRAPRLLRQAAARPSAAGGAGPLSGLLRAHARPATGARLPGGVRRRADVADGQAPPGRPRPRAPPVHARAARQHVPAGALAHARVRTRAGRAAARPVGGEDRGALRADVLVSLGPGGGVAARARRRGPPSLARRRARSAARALRDRRRVREARAARPAARRAPRGDRRVHRAPDTISQAPAYIRGRLVRHLAGRSVGHGGQQSVRAWPLVLGIVYESTRSICPGRPTSRSRCSAKARTRWTPAAPVG